MSPIAKEIIEKLNQEKDNNVLTEVLDFYDYLKHKQHTQSQIKWEDLMEDEPTEEEKTICMKYNESQGELISLGDILKELDTNGN